MKSFRTCHLVMAYVSAGYIAALVLPYVFVILVCIVGALLKWQYLNWEAMPVPRDEMWSGAVLVLFPASIILNTALFSVRYYIRRDCLMPFLCAVVVLLCCIAMPIVPKILYPGQDTHPAMIHELIAVMHFIPFIIFNVQYYHLDKKNSL